MTKPRSWSESRIAHAQLIARGAVVWDGPLYAPADLDDAGAEALLAEWSARLSAATRRAEALVGRPPVTS